MTGQAVLGLHGPIGSGKSTVARHLVEAHGFARVAFAEPLKAEVARILRRTLKAHLRSARPDVRERDDAGRVSEDQWTQYIHSALWETRDEVTRALLQEWGTDLRRAEDAEYWIRQWEMATTAHPRVVADDCRFVNEAEAIRRLGGFLVWIRRPGYEGKGHVSETALEGWSDWDFVLENDGDIADLMAEVDRIAKAVTTEAGRMTTGEER